MEQKDRWIEGEVIEIKENSNQRTRFILRMNNGNEFIIKYKGDVVINVGERVRVQKGSVFANDWCNKDFGRELIWANGIEQISIQPIQQIIC